MHWLYRTEQLAALLDASWIQKGEAGEVHILLTDSRSLSQSTGVLFFAIPGLHHNGHDYIDALYNAGVRHFVICQQWPVEQFPEANFFFVEDTITSLQAITRSHRIQFDLPVIGITGSNGKTIVKEWLFQLLHPFYAICRSPKSYNSQIGVPLSVWQLTNQDELGIFEAGISRVGEMEKLASLIQPGIGLFTNIGAAHSEGFLSEAQKIEEKSKLFAQIDHLVYCKDHVAIDAHIISLAVPLFSWGWHEQADLRLLHLRKNGQSTSITARRNGQPISIQIPFTDEIAIENAMHCWAIMLLLGHPQEVIMERMLLLESVAMRMEVIEGINNCVVINDSYNADLTGLKAGLNFINQQYNQYKRTLIISPLLESGYSKNELLHKIAKLVQNYELSRIIAIGEGLNQLNTVLPGLFNIENFATTESFLNWQAHDSFQKEVILIKGARAFGFERIARRLSQKVHQTRLEVDVNALIHNIRVFKSYLKPKTQMMIMVKAAAYGSGSLEVARALEYHKVGYLAVAYADEGIELREGGIQLPIMVLNPEEAVFDSMLRYRLEPEIYSIKLLKAFGTFTTELNQPVFIHLKVDTGMHRLGFELDQLEELHELLQGFPQLHIKSVFSHLSASDELIHDAFTHQQYQYFVRFYDSFVEQLGYRPIRHLLNSSGILRFPKYQFEMTRLGIGAYGIDSTGIAQERLQNVLSLSARVSQIKQLDTGTTVGYGRGGKLILPLRLPRFL